MNDRRVKGSFFKSIRADYYVIDDLTAKIDEAKLRPINTVVGETKHFHHVPQHSYGVAEAGTKIEALGSDNVLCCVGAIFDYKSKTGANKAVVAHFDATTDLLSSVKEIKEEISAGATLYLLGKECEPELLEDITGQTSALLGLKEVVVRVNDDFESFGFDVKSGQIYTNIPEQNFHSRDTSQDLQSILGIITPLRRCTPSLYEEYMLKLQRRPDIA